MDTKFAQDGLHVQFDGTVRDAQVAGDDLVPLFDEARAELCADESDTVRQNYYKYTMILDKSWDRNDLKQKLRNDYGVTLGGYVYDAPCHEQPAFAQWRTADLPVATDLCARHICPPVYPTLELDDARYVVESINKVLG